MSQNLLDMGLVKGDRIGIILPTTHDLLIIYLACSQIGIISVFLSPVDGKVELNYKLKKVDPMCIILYESFHAYKHLDLIKELCPELESSTPGEILSKNLPSLRHVFILQNPLNTEKKLFQGTWDFAKLSEALPNGVKHELPDVKLEDPNLILFTVSLYRKSSFLSENRKKRCDSNDMYFNLI